ncbi:hypothetical protein Tco_1504158 [Tanacetum coccineum]
MPDVPSHIPSQPTSSRCIHLQGVGILEKVNEALREFPQLATSATNNLMKENLPWLVADAVKKEREESKAAIHALISQEFIAHAPKIIEELLRIHMQNIVLNVHPTTNTSTASSSDLQQQLYLKMKYDAFRKRDHDDHPGDDAPQEGEKSAKRQKTSKSSKSARGTSSKQPAKEFNTSAFEQPQQQDFDAWVEIPVVDKDEVTPKDETLELDGEEYAYHLELVHSYMENQIVWESSQEDLTTLKKDALMFYDPQRNPNDPPRSCVIWERVHDFQLGIESYQIKINLTALTLTFPGIEACNPYSIVDAPSIGLTYLNGKEEKRVIDLVDIPKFCDATLNKVLKEVKLKIFETEFKMKISLLSELDLKIMKAKEKRDRETFKAPQEDEKMGVVDPVRPPHLHSVITATDERQFDINHSTTDLRGDQGLHSSKNPLEVQGRSHLNNFYDGFVGYPFDYRVTLGFGSIAGGLDLINPVIRLPLEHGINQRVNNLYRIARIIGQTKDIYSDMGDGVYISTLTTEQYLTLIQDNNRPGIVKLEIGNDVEFEINSNFMRELRRKLFAGNDNEDAHEHVCRVLEIVDLFHFPGVTHDVVMLRVFPITLKGRALRWKKASSRKEICNFKQEIDETLYHAWERYSDLLYRCPQHDLNCQQKVHIFYTRLDISTRRMLDSSGFITLMTSTQALISIQVMAYHSHNWYDKTTTKEKINDNPDNVDTIQESFKEAHPTKECPP